MPHTDDGLLFNFATYLPEQLEGLRPRLNARGIRALDEEIATRRAIPPAPSAPRGGTVGPTITLPSVDVTRLLRPQTLANVYAGRQTAEIRPWIDNRRYLDSEPAFACNEFKDHFTRDPTIPGNPREICKKPDCKRCDTSASQDHEYFCTCRQCHADQNRAYGHRQMLAIESTKLYACESCSRTVRSSYIGERDGCLCTLQLRYVHVKLSLLIEVDLGRASHDEYHV